MPLSKVMVLKDVVLVCDHSTSSLGDGQLVRDSSFLMIASPTFSFNKGQDAVVQVAAHHGISLPVAQLLARLHLRGTLGDVTLSGQNSAGIRGIVSLSA